MLIGPLMGSSPFASRFHWMIAENHFSSRNTHSMLISLLAVLTGIGPEPTFKSAMKSTGL
jgi:hypothetical protein